MLFICCVYVEITSTSGEVVIESEFEMVLEQRVGGPLIELSRELVRAQISKRSLSETVNPALENVCAIDAARF
jgi:hypothetical protein